MYYAAMKTDTQSKQRLVHQDWIDAAIELLVDKGISEVSVDRLAKKLCVSRGSFYHHFPERCDLFRSMLQFWAQRWTNAIIDQVGALDLAPSTTLLALMKTIRNNRAAEYDTPIRTWAQHDPLAREVVRQVDKARLGFIQSQFEELGYAGLDAENRARHYLHYEITASAMYAGLSAEREEQLLLERHRFLTAAHVE